MAVAPLAIPPFISSYAWVSLSNGLQDFGGALLVVTCAYYPLVYLPVAAALRGLDPGLEETARSLGHGAWGCFFRVVAPQLRPALYGGILLVALDVLIEFGAFALLRFRTFTTELYAQYRTGLDGPESSLLALVLIALCLVCVVGELNVRGRARYARVGSGARRIAAPVRLGWMRWPALLAFAALTMATLGVPRRHDRLLADAARPGRDLAGRAILAASLRRDARFGRLWTGRSRRGPRARGAARLSRDPLPEPPVDRSRADRLSRAGRAGHRRRAGVHFADGADDPPALSKRGAAGASPMRSCSCRSPWSGSARRWRRSKLGLEEAGRSLGLGWFAVTVRVLAPLAGPGVGAGAAMVFVFVATELTATLLLAPIGTRTLATEVWANTTSLAFAAAAPFAAMMLAISLLSTWLLAHRFGAAVFPVRA